MVRIYTLGLPLKSLKIMRNPVSGTALVSHPFFLFLSFIGGIYPRISGKCDKHSGKLGLLGETLEPTQSSRARLIDARLDNQRKGTSVFASKRTVADV